MAAAALPIQSRAPESRRYFGGLRVGMQSATYRQFSLDEAIARTVALGLKYFELSPAHADLSTLGTAEVRELRRRLLDAGLSTPTYGVVNAPSKGRGRLEEIFRRAQEFGFQAVLVNAAPARVMDVARLAGRGGVTIAFHNQSEPPEAIAEMLRDCPPGCGTALDTGNYLSAGADPAAAIAKLRGRIRSVHLKDIARPGVTCVLGRGRADVPAIVNALDAARYDNVVALEYDESPENPDAGVAASLQYLKMITVEGAR